MRIWHTSEGHRHVFGMPLFLAVPKVNSGKKGMRRVPVRCSARASHPPARLVDEADEPQVESDSADEVIDLRLQNELLREQLRQTTAPQSAASPQPSTSAQHLPPTQAVLTPTVLAPAIEPNLRSISGPSSPPMQPPESQDILLGILQQMSATQPDNNSTGENNASIAHYLTLGVNLDQKTKTKIGEGGYVELGFLISPSDTSVSVAVGDNGQPSISLAPVRAKPPANITEWLRLFATYASVALQVHPHEASPILTYMVRIMDMAKRHGGYAWRLYCLRAMAPQLPWHLTNWDIALEAINTPMYMPHPQQAQTPFRAAQRPGGKEVCYDYNGHGRCTINPCPYPHICAMCRKPGHSRRSCRASIAGRAFGGQVRTGRQAVANPGHAVRTRPAITGARPGYNVLLQNTLIDGFTKGFRISSSMQHPSVSNKYSNHPSVVIHSDVVSAKLQDDMAMNRIVSPFDIPTPSNCILSPLAVVPKKASGEFRLIHDVSPETTVQTAIYISLTQPYNTNSSIIVSQSFVQSGQTVSLRKQTLKMPSAFYRYIQKTTCWVLLGEVNFISTNASPWAAAPYARFFNVLLLHCSGFLNRSWVYTACLIYSMI